MEVNDALIDNLAKLSRLQFDPREREEIKSDLQRMIAFVEKLKEVDTAGTPPLQHMTEAFDVYREDEVRGSMDRAAALANAPGAGNEYFRVPKVIKK